MARRKSVNMIRDVGVDPRYGSEVIQKFINVIMWRGKKNVARTIVYDALDLVGKKINSSEQEKVLKVFFKALENVMPVIEVRPRRVGGSVYQVPVEVKSRRATALAMRWLMTSASARGDKTMGLRLGHELFDAPEGRGGAVKKRTDVHKMAESNRALAHYAW